MAPNRVTLRVTLVDPADLAAIVAAVEGLGHRVECPVFDGWSRLAKRDSYLREAHALMPGPYIWQKSAQLAADILYFESRLWPRWSHYDEPPAELSEARRFLFRARKLGNLPGSDKQLHNIATKSSPPTSTGAT